MNADRYRVTVAEGALLAAMKAGGTAADFVNALDAGGHLQTPGEVRDLMNRVARSRTAWKSARGRARSTGSAADRYAARARDLQHALQDMVGAQLALQMQRDAALRRLAELDLSPSCDRCRCTDDHACDGGCVWVPNPYGLDVCSECLTLEGRCTTPLCGDIEKPSMLGWILVDVAGSDVPPRFHCSPWCAALAIQSIGMRLTDVVTACASCGGSPRCCACDPEHDQEQGKDTATGDESTTELAAAVAALGALPVPLGHAEQAGGLTAAELAATPAGTYRCRCGHWDNVHGPFCFARTCGCGHFAAGQPETTGEVTS
jgi:hypothetical protein